MSPNFIYIMKTIINFKNGFSVFKSSRRDNSFPYCFDFLELKIAEPDCPFCGVPLHNALCHCRQYRKALRLLGKAYRTETVGIMTSIKTVMTLPFNQENFDMTETCANILPPNLFDNGSKVARQKGLASTWLLSSGEYIDDTLAFYAREFGKNKIYKCRIKNLILPVALNRQTVHLCEQQYGFVRTHNKTGGYRTEIKNKILTEFSYQEFLDKLREQVVVV